MDWINAPEVRLRLLTLVVGGELNGRELAQAFGQSAGHDIPIGILYRIMDALVNEGLATVREVNETRRLRYYGITPQGREMVSESGST